MISYHLASNIFQRKVEMLKNFPRTMNGGHNNFAHPLPSVNYEMATTHMAPEVVRHADSHLWWGNKE